MIWIDSTAREAKKLDISGKEISGNWIPSNQRYELQLYLSEVWRTDRETAEAEGAHTRRISGKSRFTQGIFLGH